MLVFCPTCASALIVEEGPSYLRFGCFSCPYVHNITRVIVARTYPQLKVGQFPLLMLENVYGF
jgi:DNA-directed RNA polymerase III subunit RPC11